VVEAEPPATAAAYVRDTLLTGRAGTRAHPHFPFGQYSDDTQLARELLLSLRDAGRWNPPAFAERVAGLVREERDVGAGPGTRGAALRLAAGSPWHASGAPAPYAGNGSAMRVGPLGALLADDIGALRRVTAEQSRITHVDARCTAGAVAVACAAAFASSPDFEPRATLDRVAGCAAAEEAGVGEAIASVAGWLSLEPEDAAERLRRAGLDPGHESPWRGISAYVVPSVAWSLYAFLRSPDDYWAAVCTAIAVGGDTDTMAAMTGAMAGARLGVGALPADLLALLTDRGTWGAGPLDALARDCARLFTPSGSSC
jgi:ADP-ribosylglycohydrolase